MAKARVLAVALVDLAEHDQRHHQVIEQAQEAIEIDGGLSGLDPFRDAWEPQPVQVKVSSERPGSAAPSRASSRCRPGRA
jgi:hypothetical protein